MANYNIKIKSIDGRIYYAHVMGVVDQIFTNLHDLEADIVWRAGSHDICECDGNTLEAAEYAGSESENSSHKVLLGRIEICQQCRTVRQIDDAPM